MPHEGQLAEALDWLERAERLRTPFPQPDAQMWAHRIERSIAALIRALKDGDR